MCVQQRLRPACTYTQTDQSLPLLLEYFMTVKLLTKQDFAFLCLTGGCTGSSEFTLVKMRPCWKSLATAQLKSEYEKEMPKSQTADQSKKGGKDQETIQSQPMAQRGRDTEYRQSQYN